MLLDLEAIRAATKDFSEENMLGEGGFGVVYKVQFFVRFGVLYVVNVMVLFEGIYKLSFPALVLNRECLRMGRK